MTTHAPGGGNLSVKPNELYVDAAYAGAQSNGSEGAPFLTITEALAVAAAADLVVIAPGAYVEDLVLIDEVDLKSLVPESVTVTGTCTATDVSCVLQGINFIDDTAGSAFHFTGTAADTCRFILCEFTATATGGPAYTADNTLGTSSFQGCQFAVTGANASEVCQIEAGIADFRECALAHGTNTNEALVAEGDAATDIRCRDCTFTGTIGSEAAVANPTIEISNCSIVAGAVSGVVVAAGNTVVILDSDIACTDAGDDAIDGAGTVTIKDLAFMSTADEIATTITVTHFLGSWIQHGEYTEAAGAGTRAIALPQIFPSVTYTVMVTYEDTGAGAQASSNEVDTLATTGFNVTTQVNGVYHWMAIHD